MMGSGLTATGDQTFKQDVLDSKIPVLVDFWAEWCGPCKTLTPRVEEVAKIYNGKVKVLAVDIDQNPTIPTTFNIRSVPTLLMFKDGQLVGQLVGSQPISAIDELVKKTL